MNEKTATMRPASSVQRNLFPKAITIFLKMFVSGVLALFILTLLCNFYRSIPLQFVDESGATDCKFEHDKFFVTCSEGFSWGRTNNDGYLNLINYENGMPIQILVTGSSHMEARQVMIKDNTAGALEKLSNKIVYNIGMTGHHFAICAVNLEAALKKYMPSEYVIIETTSVNFSDDELENIISRNRPKPPAYHKGILLFLRKNIFLRLLAAQFQKSLSEGKTENNYASNHAELLTEVLKMLKETAQSYGVKLIIAYHPSITLNKNGTISINGNPDITAQFSELCAQNGIYFIDTGKRFLDEYAKDYTLPYGFMNTSVGGGHMNKNGHRMFAEEIYKLIQRIEAQS